MEYCFDRGNMFQWNFIYRWRGKRGKVPGFFSMHKYHKSVREKFSDHLEVIFQNVSHCTSIDAKFDADFKNP